MGNDVSEVGKSDKPLKFQADGFYKIMRIIWNRLPGFKGTMLATAIVFIVGSTMRGDWIMILVHFIKSSPKDLLEDLTPQERISRFTLPTLESLKLGGLMYYIAANTFFALLFYFAVCGFLKWWFYHRQRDHPETWKCQPKKWVDSEVEKHDKYLGTRNIVIGSIIFGTLACYIDNGGYTTLYDRWDEHGWLYLFLSIPIHFIYQDAGAYYCHRLFHTKYMYKRFHKAHHLNKTPTPYSVSAFSGVEFLCLQGIIISPTFLAPLHSVVYFLTILYHYYYGIMQHSGINIESMWPWQPDVMFHDNHHQYFHVNFGFNLTIWDKLHGTYRKKNAYYDETTWGGRGKELSQTTKEEFEDYKKQLENEIKVS